MARTAYQAKLIDDWLVIYTLETQDGYPVVKELRVLPCPPEIRTRPLVEWNGELVPVEPMIPEINRVLRGELKPGPTPPGGLTSRFLRRLTPAGAQAQHHEVLSYVSERTAREHGYNPAGEPRRPGPKGRDDRFYAEIARAYIEASRTSRRPVVDVAEDHHFTPEYVRDVLHDARVRGILTPSPPGKAGGQLTQKALDALSQP